MPLAALHGMQHGTCKLRLYSSSGKLRMFNLQTAEAARAFLQQRLRGKVKRTNDMLRPARQLGVLPYALGP